MRGKLIAVFSIIVIVTGLLSFVLMRVTVGDVVGNPDRARGEADRAVRAATAQLQLEGLSFQRWLTEIAQEPKVREPFVAGTTAARSDLATGESDRIMSLAAAEFSNVAPSLIAFIDDQGIALGRNGSNLMRGDNLGKVYPSLLATIKKGTSGSDVWVNRTRNEQLLVSYATVRDANNKVLGLLMLGTPLDDNRLGNVSNATSGKPVVLAIAGDAGVDVVAKTPSASPAVVAAVGQGGLKAEVAPTMAAPQLRQLANGPAEFAVSGMGLPGYGAGNRAAIIAFAPVSLVENLTSVLLPIFGGTAVGLILAIAASLFLGNYFTSPIAELEEGLLAIINGQTERRFELEHPELGGLVFRINTLLNTLMGVPEDDTDAQGRPSQAPSASHFSEAVAVDAGAEAAALRSEPAEAYYNRIYNEYIDAKRRLGHNVDQITRDVFVNKIKASEADASSRQGKPVRYRVELKGDQVNLVAVPLE